MSSSGREIRCTSRKHVIEKTARSCDCGALMIWDTAARNAHVIQLRPELTEREIDWTLLDERKM